MLISAEHLSINFGSRQLLDDVDFGGQGVAGLFPQGLVHPADELAVRSLGCNGPDGFMAGWYSPPFPRYAA